MFFHFLKVNKLLLSSLILILNLEFHLAYVFAQSVVQNEINWLSSESGISLGQIEKLEPDALFSPSLILIKANPKLFRVNAMRAIDFGEKLSRAQNISKKSHAIAAINANFFDEKGDPLGLVVTQGIQNHGIHFGGNTLTGVFYRNRNGYYISHRSEYPDNGAIEAIQAGPRLVVNSKIAENIRNSEVRSRRSGMCLTNDNQLIFYITNGVSGVSLRLLQNLLVSDRLNCRDTLNLDGGGSAQLFFSAEKAGFKEPVNDINIHGTDAVPVFLGLFPKK